jgi:dolichyl-phosphate beta-glucosyltransferase
MFWSKMINSISIIYPIFNEEKRLKKTFLDIEKFEKKNKFFKTEFIFVNDGSSDKTLSILNDKFQNNKKFKIINYKKNMGKGYALKRGVKIAKNDWILTTDADCSVSNFQLLIWIKKKYLNNKNLIYFGSRNHPLSNVKKKLTREIIGIIFKIIIRIFYNISISDTQCGFKLYKSVTAKKIFEKILTNGYMHDIELCLIAKKLNHEIKDLPIKWTHINNSKINFFNDFFKIMLSLIKISKYKY